MTRLIQATHVVVLSLFLGVMTRADEPRPEQGVRHVPLNRVIKDELLKALPRDITVHKSHNWNQQAPMPSIRGVRLVEVRRNHGNWEKMTLVCPNPRGMRVVVDNLIFPSRDRVAFTVHIDLPADLDFEKQTWQNGVQIYGGHCRGRARFATEFHLETEVLPKNGRPFDRNVPRFEITDARCSCYGFVPEHVNLVGGDLALLSGGGFYRTFTYYQAGFEQHILALIRAALARACEGPEIAAAWSGLLAALTAQMAPPDTPPIPELPVTDELIGAARVRRGPVARGSVCPDTLITINVLLNGHRPPPALHTSPTGPARFDVRSIVSSRASSALFSGLLHEAGSSGHGPAENAGSAHGHSEHGDHKSKDYSGMDRR